MGRVFFHRSDVRTTSFLWMGMAVFLLFSCGLHEQAEVAHPGDRGSVVFSVKWVSSNSLPDRLTATIPAAQPLADIDICTANGIDQVKLEIWRDGSPPTSTGVKATQACDTHTATLNGVPANIENLYVELSTVPVG